MRYDIFSVSFCALLVTAMAMDIQCPASEPLNAEMKKFCEESIFDSIHRIGATNDYYVFKGDMVLLRLASGVIPPVYPMPMNKIWPSSPKDIDAMFTYSTTGKTYIVKDAQYWRYSMVNTTYSLDDGFPRSMDEGFNGVPSQVDDAVEWGKYIYFFKGSMYYRYDPCKNETYNVPMSDFNEIPINIDGVSRSPDGTYAYFWKGESYYTYNIAANALAGNLINMNRRWLSCKS